MLPFRRYSCLKFGTKSARSARDPALRPPRRTSPLESGKLHIRPISVGPAFLSGSEGVGCVSEESHRTIETLIVRKRTLASNSRHLCVEVIVLSQNNVLSVASVSFACFVANQVPLRCRFAFSADFVPQLVTDLIADIWYWMKTIVMEKMMSEYIWKIGIVHRVSSRWFGSR